MKHYSKSSFLVFVCLSVITLILISSCTVHKRVHRKGWFVQWHFNKSDSHKNKEASIELSQDVKDEENQIFETIERDAKEGQTTLNTERIDDTSDPTQKNELEIIETDIHSKSPNDNDSEPLMREYVPGGIVALSTAAAAVAASGLLLWFIGVSPYLVPLGFTFIIALVMYFTLRQAWRFLPQEIAERKTRQNLGWMFTLSALAFGFTYLFLSFSLTSPIFIVTAFLVSLFLLIVFASQNQYEKDANKESNQLAEDEPIQQEENTVQTGTSEQKITSISVLPMNKAFPSLTAGIAICTVFTVLITIALLLIAAASSLLGITLGIYFFSTIGFALLLFGLAIVLAIIRKRNYDYYLEDALSEQRTASDSTNTNNSEKTQENNDKVGIAVAIFFIVGVIAIAAAILAN